MSFPISFVGKEFEGHRKWHGGALASNGCIYAAPSWAKQILKIHPRFSPPKTRLVGQPLEKGFPKYEKYAGCVCSDKKPRFVYFVPHNASQVLRLNIGTEKWELIGEDFGSGTSGIDKDAWKWSGGALGSDGCIYCAPFCHKNILKIDPTEEDDSQATSLIAKDLPGEHKYSGAVASADGTSIYFIPACNKDILKYDVVTKNITSINIGHLADVGDFSGGVLGPDGCIYCIPDSAAKILKYDATTAINEKPEDDKTKLENPSLVGNGLGNERRKWYGGVMAWNDCIIGIPADVPNILQYDTQNGTAARVGPDLRGQDLKWCGGVLDTKGDIYAIPYDHSRVLRIVPSLLTFGAGGITDSPKGIDRLGHELYAKALVKHIVSMETNREAVSVGLFSPWGSGKTFFWNLIQNEFKMEEGYEEDNESLDGSSDEGQNLKTRILIRLKAILMRLKGIILEILPWEEQSHFVKYLENSVYLISKFVRTTLRTLFSFFFFCFLRSDWKDPEESGKRVVVNFNTWTYKGTDNVWASMLEDIWKKVEDALGGAEKVQWHRLGIVLAKDDIKASDTRKERSLKQETARMRFQITQNAKISIFAWIATVSYWSLVWVIRRQKEAFEASFKTSVILVAVVGFLTSIAGLVQTSFAIKEKLQNGISDITNTIEKYKRKDFTKDLGFHRVVREEVKYLFQYLDSRKARVLLFVDDLDRCDPKTAMDVLWAISLLFGSTDADTAPITSFLAVDTKILVDYIETNFDSQSNVNGFRFLEKIIHLPFSIPPIDKEGKKRFCEQTIFHNQLDVSRIYGKALQCQNRKLFEHLPDMKEVKFSTSLETQEMHRELLKCAIVLGLRIDFEYHQSFEPSKKERIYVVFTKITSISKLN